MGEEEGQQSRRWTSEIAAVAVYSDAPFLTGHSAESVR
jgi:hypothetical protein